MSFFFFFFNATAPTEIYTLSLHDALPIWSTMLAVWVLAAGSLLVFALGASLGLAEPINGLDRKSTRLNSSHVEISYAVFCLKKKKKTTHIQLSQTYRELSVLPPLINIFTR